MGLGAGEMVTTVGRRVEFTVLDTVAFGDRSILKTAVLNQLGIQSAVTRMVNLFEEDAVHG